MKTTSKRPSAGGSETLNASHLDTQRMVQEYIVKPYFQEILASQPKTKKQYENERY